MKKADIHTYKPTDVMVVLNSFPLDTERLELKVFDCVLENGETFEERVLYLQTLDFSTIPIKTTLVKHVLLSSLHEEESCERVRERLLHRARTCKIEGFVLKKRDMPYVTNSRVRTGFKLKFRDF